MKYRILIVDDVAKNIQLLATILEPAECDIEFAMNGNEALDWIKNEDFDLILLDVMMPDKNGYEVCQEIKALPDKKDIPVIFLTAKNDLDSITKGFDMGGADYVTKPYNSKELIARIHNHAELKRGREQLKKMNEMLEVKVKERTHELELAKKQLETLDTAKTEFLNIISHEVRTPLNGIINAYELLKNPSNTKNFNKLIHVLDDSVARLEQYSFTALQITQLITLKDEALNLREVAFTDILDKGLKVLTNKCESKDVKINVEVLTKKRARGDFNFLKSAFVNILDNAIEYALPGSKVSVQVSEVDDKIVLSVKDQGPGFSEKALNNLFKPYSPGEAFVNHNSGLGLFFVKLLVDAHSGSIKAGNTHEGAYIEIAIPMEKK